jgi:hypothetical protein
MRYRILPPLKSHKISQLRSLKQVSWQPILAFRNPPVLPVRVRYKISPAFKYLCWRELCRY